MAGRLFSACRHSRQKNCDQYLDDLGWARFDELMVMTVDLANVDLSGALDQIPLKDIGRFIDAGVAGAG